MSPAGTTNRGCSSTGAGPPRGVIQGGSGRRPHQYKGRRCRRTGCVRSFFREKKNSRGSVSRWKAKRQEGRPSSGVRLTDKKGVGG